MVKGKEEAEAVAESLFELRINFQDVDTDHFYSKKFWEITTKEKWDDLLRLVYKALGRLESYSLQSWNVQSKVQTGGMSGTIVRLVYDTTYEKGKGSETLVIHKPLRGDTFAIVGHHYHSDKIQELIDKGIEQVASVNST